jgi:hypothetical protein
MAKEEGGGEEGKEDVSQVIRKRGMISWHSSAWLLALKEKNELGLTHISADTWRKKT